MDELDADRVGATDLARSRHDLAAQQASQSPRQKHVGQNRDDRRDHVIAMQRPCQAHAWPVSLYGARSVSAERLGIG